MSNRQKSAHPPVYDDFQPKIESKDEPETRLLLIHLPGFKGEQIKAQYDSSFRRVKVSGERQVGADNRRSRFSVLYSVPESCDTSKLRRKFDNEILIIIMPKKVIPRVTPKEEPKPTEQAKPPQPATQPKAEKTQEVVPPKAVEMAQKSQDGTSEEPKSAFDSKKQEDEKEDDTSILSKTKSESLSQKGQEQEPKLASDSQDQSADGKKVETISPPKAASEPMPQKRQEGTPQKAAPSTDTKVPAEGATTMPRSENDEKQEVEKKETEEDKVKSLESGKPIKKDDDSFTEKQNKEGSKESTSMAADESSVPKISEKEKAKDKKEMNGESDGGVGEDHRKDRNDSKVKGKKEAAASASRAMTRLAKRFNEDDKQMMTYIGAAAVVAIAALGVYAFYKYRVGKS